MASCCTTRWLSRSGAKLLSDHVLASAADMRRQAAVGRRERRAAERVFKPAVRALLHWAAAEVVRLATGERVSGKRIEEEQPEVTLDVWEAFGDAVDAMMREFPKEAVVRLLPQIMETARRGYEVTCKLTGDPVVQDRIEQAMRGNSAKVASRITSIGETTRDRFKAAIQKAAQEGLSPIGLAQEMYGRFNEVSDSRIPTIARTEMMNAYNDGAVASFQGSSVVTHVSVIGCMSRERDRWGDPSWAQFMYRGESTCNIENVSVQDCHLLGFHYNHTGCMVASKYRELTAE